jgi:predicted choloylglycine hydrolase
MNTGEKTVLSGSESFMTVRHLMLRGSNFEIGRRLGQIARERYGQEPSRYAADPTYATARRVYFQRNYPIHWERVQGVASAFGVDAEDWRYDFTSLTYLFDMPPPIPGCSVVYYPPSTTATGHGYLSRNYDFSTGTIADVMGIPQPAEARSQSPPVMSEPYIMEWYPLDGGYPSIAIQAFDILSGTLDGMNSEGLVVAILADEEAIAELGPRLEVHPTTARAVGLHELQLMRLLLDTCATVEEAREALLTSKQFYTFVPNHYIVADRSGNSFVYLNSTGRNVQHIIGGQGRPQVVSNFQLHRHPTLEHMPDGPLTFQTNAFWRYRTLADLIARQDRPFELEDLKSNNAHVNVGAMIQKMGGERMLPGMAANVAPRTLWHSIYDQQAGTARISFYLGEPVEGDGERDERRSRYLEFPLSAGVAAR